MPKTALLVKILENESLTSDGLVKKMTLLAPWLATAKPGQFVHLKVTEGCQPLLRRPFSIAGSDMAEGTITVIYRIVGKGTAIMGGSKPGEYLDCMGPLGNGFTMPGERPLLVGGGMGLAPLLFLAGGFKSEVASVLMGGRNAGELFWAGLFSGLKGSVHLATDDGSLGLKGLATQFLPEILANEKFDVIYACGPLPMLKKTAEIAKKHALPCQVSLEEYMACGVGACLSCTCADTFGKRRKVCADGPVFDALEVEW